MPAAALESRKALALAIARRLYGFAPTAAVRLRSEAGFVFRVEFGGLQAKVVKLPGRTSGILREQRIIRALRRGRWQMPVPAIEFTQDDLPAWDRPPGVTVMSLCPGMTLGDAILRGETWAGEAMREAGAIAARLADVPSMILGRAHRRQPESEAYRALRWIEPVIEQFALGCLPPFLRLVTQGERQPARTLAHCAFLPGNMLAEPVAGGMRLWVLDWEAAQPGSPLADLAWLLASLAELCPDDSGQRAYLRRRAIDGYSALRPLDEDEAHKLRAREAILLLSIARYHLEAQLRDKAASLATMAADCATG